MNSLLESWQAKLAAPFAVLGIRTIGDRVAGIEYLPRTVATLKPQTNFCARGLHRVVASQGIGGFMNVPRGVPIAVKRWLLHHENPGAY